MLLCKEDLVYNGVQVLTKGTFYNYGIGGHSEYGREYKDYVSINSNLSIPNFYFHRNMGFHSLYVWDYFYTNQEMRKFKLEKLSDGSESL